MSGQQKNGLNRDQFAQLLAEQVDFLVAAPPAQLQPRGTAQKLAIGGFHDSIVFPGAFDPLHEGHLTMAKLASQRCRRPVWFEISVENVDKPALDFTEVANRSRQVHHPHGLILTRTPTFERKAELFGGCIFVVGADTIARINQPRYYRHDVEQMQRSLQAIAKQGCRFLVFARKSNNKACRDPNFQPVRRLDPRLEALCEFVSADEFLMEISSTDIRQRQKTGD